jgi:hypothetical protein
MRGSLELLRQHSKFHFPKSTSHLKGAVQAPFLFGRARWPSGRWLVIETASDEIAVAKAHTIYTPFMLSNLRRAGPRPVEPLRVALPHGEPIEIYRTNLSANHLEAGVRTGSSTTARAA